MNEDKQSEMLADHHADLIHEHQLENCVHEEWQVEGIEDLVYTECFGSSYMKCEISCCFCGKTNSIHIRLKALIELLNRVDVMRPVVPEFFELVGQWDE